MQLDRAIALSRAKQKKCICKVVMIYAKIVFLYLFPFIVMFAVGSHNRGARKQNLISPHNLNLTG